MFLDEKKIGETKVDVFLTAEQLGIPEDEYQALLKVLRMLETGELEYISQEEVQAHIFGSHLELSKKKRYFNISYWHSSNWSEGSMTYPKNKCGTVGCIGGWAEAFLGKKMSLRNNRAFNDLFFPRGVLGPNKVTGELTADRCIKAMRAKLTTGKADWS